MPFSVYLAFKYLKSKVLLVIPIIGLTLGSGTLIVVHSVMKGFAVDLEKIAKGLSLDLIIYHYQNEYFSFEEASKVLENIPNVRKVIPSIETYGILKFQTDTKPVKLWAIPYNALPQNWQQYFYPSISTNKSKKLVGYIGCSVNTYTSYFGKKAKFLTLLPTDITLPIKIEVNIIGHFCTNLYEYDKFYLVVDLKNYQKALANFKVNTVYIQVKDIKNLKETARLVNEKLNKNSRKYYITSGTYERKSLLTAVEVERNITQIIITLILITTGFGFGSLLYIKVVNKTKEIGYLKSLGATNTQVLVVFLIIALLVSVAGSMVGTTLGYFFARNINEIAKFLEQYTGFQLFPPQEYLFYTIPYYWSWKWCFTVIFLNIAILLSASILPALKAAKLNPAVALKNE
ncbi:MAG: ABC transporter permease [Planctomycetota bacterium]